MSDALRINNLHFGNMASNYNQAHIGFTSVGIGSTANYGVLQFVGVPNTLCWTANGTVGIGTTNPGYTIDVNGSSSAVGLSILRSTAISGSGRISYYNNTGSVQYWLLGSISSLVGNYGGSIDINGDLVRVDTALKNVQFGCSVNYNNFTVNRSSASGTTGTANGNIVVYRNTTTSLYDVYLVFGSYSSFVGDVIYSGATINLTPNLVAAPSASGTYLLVWDSSVNTYMAITNSGNVGIGTTNPQGTLDINGIIYVGTGANVGGQGMYINTGWINSLNYNEYAPFQVAIRNTKVFVINTNGNVGIGVVNPSTLFHVNGDITASRIIANSYNATDDRSISPSEIPTNSVKPFFSSWNNNSGGFYADAIGFNSYTDGSGGNSNLLMIYKNGFGIRQYQAAFGSATRFSDYMDCCMKTDGTQSLTSFTATAYNPNPTLIVGCKTGTSPMYSLNQAGIIVTDGNLHLDASRRSIGSSTMYYGFYANQDGNPNNHQFYGNVYMNSALNVTGTVTAAAISTTTYNGTHMRFGTVANNDAPNGGPGYNSGYVILVGGLCIQWGMKSSQNGGAQYPSYINFPIAFTTVYICLGCSGYGAASGPGALSNTGCQFSAGGNTVTYIAIGYYSG